jgi:hypothetical protein
MQTRIHTLIYEFDRRGASHADVNAALAATVRAAGGERFTPHLFWLNPATLSGLSGVCPRTE